MRAIRAHLSMYPKWLLFILLVFLITFILSVTVFINFTLMLINLALLFGAYSVREIKGNQLAFVLCLTLCITFILFAFKTYPL